MKIKDDDKTIDVDVEQEIINFYNNPEVAYLSDYYNQCTTWDRLGVARQETSHSSFLAWLLNPKGNHGLGEIPLRKFLRLLVSAQKLPINDIVPENDKINDTLERKFICDSYPLNDCSIEREYSCTCKDGNNGRIDIFITFKLNTEEEINIVLENKVGAPETIKEDGGKKCYQTTTYYNFFSEKKEECVCQNFYVFLSPLSNNDLQNPSEDDRKKKCHCKSYIFINYQGIVDYVIDPILQSIIPENTKSILQDYLRTLGKPSLLEEQDNKKSNKEIIMAMCEKEKKLLEEFLKVNETLFKVIAQNVEETDPQLATALDDYYKTPIIVKIDGEDVSSESANKTYRNVFLRLTEGKSEDELRKIFKVKGSGSGMVVTSGKVYGKTGGQDKGTKYKPIPNTNLYFCINYGREQIRTNLNRLKKLFSKQHQIEIL